MVNIVKHDMLVHIETNPNNIKINFDEFPEVRFKAKEINNCILTGTYKQKTERFKGNIVMSSLIDFRTENADLTNVDWKDSNFRGCIFNHTILDICAVINCHYSHCRFERCRFDDMAITGSIFYEVSFKDCDLSNIVIENCKFYNCSFINCKSSNKIFEHCLLFNSKFIKTDIQLQTITENFGLESNQFKNCLIYYSMPNQGQKYLDHQGLEGLISSDSTLHDFYKFKIEYFLNPNITMTGSVLLDQIFMIEEWIPLCKAQVTFVNMFKSFHDFFLIQFEQNKAILLILYKLKHLTYWISNQESIRANFELFPLIIGYDIGLERIISQTNSFIAKTNSSLKEKITFLVEGPLKKEFYYSALKLFVKDEFVITQLKKQNSPNLLEITAIAGVMLQIIALFTVTRVKLELNRRKERKKPNKKRKNPVSNLIKINPYQLGLYNKEMTNKEIFDSYNRHSLSLNINYLEYKTEDAGIVRKIVIDILE